MTVNQWIGAVLALLIVGIDHFSAIGQRDGTLTVLPISGGQLRFIDPVGKPAGICPLKHTDVEASITATSACTLVRHGRRRISA